jgi:hypothetical protein
VPVDDIAHAGSSLLAEAVTRLRSGQVIREAGGCDRARRRARNLDKIGISSISPGLRTGLFLSHFLEISATIS